MASIKGPLCVICARSRAFHCRSDTLRQRSQTFEVLLRGISISIYYFLPHTEIAMKVCCVLIVLLCNSGVALEMLCYEHVVALHKCLICLTSYN